MESSYLKASRIGLLQHRIATSRELLSCCTLCPRKCGVNRLLDERGFCTTGKFAEVASYGPHFGEESVLVGEHGSGTIFFCGCNLRCVFCQNFDISHPQPGACREVGDEELAGIMVELQAQGCHNINFVTPSHVVPQILSALPHAIDRGLTIPLVYNCGGYESLESLRLLEAIVDIYMPDCKFFDRQKAENYLKAPDYPERVQQALVEMQQQVGDLEVDASGVGVRGLLVRHLLMPDGEEDTQQIISFLAETISSACYLNLMDQYRPCGHADQFAELQAGISHEQHRKAMKFAEDAGMTHLDRKDLGNLIARLFKT